MPRFVIDFGSVEMPLEDQNRLSADLQKVAVGYLANIKLENPVAAVLPKEWMGLYVHPASEMFEPFDKRMVDAISHMTR